MPSFEIPAGEAGSAEAADPALYRFADVEFDVLEGQLRVRGQPVTVEPRPLRLLAELLRHANEVLTKEELLVAVWEGRPTVDHVLANAVSKLRTALGEQGAARLVTVARVGYRLVGPVQRVLQRAAEVSLQPGQPVPGREGYVLSSPLGGGAHGDVWLARHLKLGQQRVFKFASDGARLAALKREFTLYRVLANELGPRDDFARVLDSHFVSAPFFIECEFGGQSLLDWASTAPALSAMPQAERVALFLQAARAVAAAHGVGVLHKDIKPGNILIRPAAAAAGTTWQLLLTDFGSGRLLDLARLEGLQLTALDLTQTQDPGSESRSGTLMYLAPELLKGQAPTVQSDLYALGLLLWQLLVGDFQRPLATGWQRELDDELLIEDIAAATEGFPEDRLPSVADLVDRLQRLPERRAARAAAQLQAAQATATAVELASSRARRPWVWAALASLGLGLAASLVLAQQARQAGREAQAQAELAEAQRARADAVNSFLAEDFLAGIDLARAGPDGTVSMRAVLERASERAGQRFAGQPATEGQVRIQLASLFHLLSMFPRSETEYRRALALADDQALKTDPALLQARFSLIANLAVNDGIKEARELLPQAEADAGPAALAASSPLAQTAILARTLVLHSSEDFKAALPAAEKLLALADASANPTRPDDWFSARLILGDTLTRLGQLDRAAEVLDQALAIPAGRSPPSEVSQARGRVLQARVLIAQGRAEGIAAAEPALLAARSLLASRVGPDEHYVSVADAELAALFQKRGDFERARQAFAAVHASYLRSFGADHPHTRVMTLNLAIAELNTGRPAEALRKLVEGRAWFVEYTGGEQGAVVQAVDFERARALTSLQRASEALPILARLDPRALAAAAPARDWDWRLQAEQGRALLGTGARAQGQAALRKALPGLADNGSPLWVQRAYAELL